MMGTLSCGISINIYGRGDIALGDGPSHMAIALYELGSSTCEMYHIRNPSDDIFIFDPRTQPMEDPTLKGRCELVLLSPKQQQHAASLLSSFGDDESNIPDFGIGNCQDWVAGAVGILEQAGIVSSGEGQFWKSMINRSSEEMKTQCLQGGKRWIDGPESTHEGEPDARFADKELNETKPVGKLSQNDAFQARMKSLLGANGGGENDRKEKPVERSFYVSSPFFSKMDQDKD